MAVPVPLGSAEPAYILDSARWGFIPKWWKQPEAPRATINARAESVVDKPMWRDAFAKPRCLVPALSWYEWAQREHIDTETGEVQKIKQPHFLHGADNGLVLSAAVYSEREDDRTRSAHTVALLTCPAQGSAADVHDRMPVILQQDAAARWVGPAEHDKQKLESVLVEHRGRAIAAHPISRRVNSPRNDDPSLIEATDDAAA